MNSSKQPAPPAGRAGTIVLAAVLALAALGTRAAQAADGDAAKIAAAEAAQPKKVRVIDADGGEAKSSVPLTDVERYCTNIADPAKDARAALQTKRLQDLEAEVSRKIDELEAKRREYQDWLQQRQAFLDSTSSIMLDIYAKMKPDAAAAQLAGLDRTTAASVISKLKARAASAIMTEMPAPAAAEIGKIITQKTSKPADATPAAAGQG